MVISQMFKFPFNDLPIGRRGYSLCVYKLMCVVMDVKVIIQHRFTGSLLCLCQALGISVTNKLDVTSELTGLPEGDTQ